MWQNHKSHLKPLNDYEFILIKLIVCYKTHRSLFYLATYIASVSTVETKRIQQTGSWLETRPQRLQFDDLEHVH